MRDHKDLQGLVVPLVGLVGDVEALLPHPAVLVVEGQERVHGQHLRGQDRVSMAAVAMGTCPRPLPGPRLTCSSVLWPLLPRANWQSCGEMEKKLGRASGGSTQEPLGVW